MSTDAELSREVARQAGQRLLDLRTSFGAIAPGDSDRANALRKQGDRSAHELIVAALAEARPDDAILSEEGQDHRARLDADRVWIVDPLDGTWEFGQDRSDFAVHIALWDAKAGAITSSTVDLPAQRVTRTMDDETPTIPPLAADRPLRIVASRSRPPAALPRIVDVLSRLLAEAGVTDHGVEIIDVGSVGAKVNEVLSGRAEAYLHNTGFYEWDVAAPYGVAHHYGLIASHMDGAPVQFNQMPPYVNDLMVSRPEIIDHLRIALSEAAPK